MNPSRDPARTLAMLWGVEVGASRGPRPSRTVDEIGAAAVALADADGVAGLSMRRLASALGVGTMSLYTYVQNKDDLVDLVVDRAYAEMYSDDVVPGDTWRDRLLAVGWENWRLLMSHPWLLDVDLSRPVLGPGETRRYDLELGAGEEAGLSDVALDAAVTLVVSTATHAVRRQREAEQVRALGGQTDEAWWERNAALLALVGERSTYARAARVGAAVGEAQAAGWSATAELEFGLTRVVDGIGAHLSVPAPTSGR
ncbi:Tetracyclin repressor, C-terminal all-alpha domain [Paraoerskovia marina]|uniref:Tetracyclin repressor, C-terminal all-alpha domain n=1 Tax=Paraoerskovia marina TaxID=545619 RepID=A0A1H1VZU5_9CELL|nr:TetR/AcrR family transcriptional regulator [Paraoerskovia marina]SDS89766.1 Tetracyclin repressor, C-terminal all-alpha domain [Paraoerskovia marina]